MKFNKRWWTKTATAAKPNNEWTNEMELELLKIDREERSKGTGFMKRMKERWDEKYPGLLVTAQCLRDSPTRVSKDKALLNQLEVQDQRETVNNANHVDVIPGPKINHCQTMETENTNR